MVCIDADHARILTFADAGLPRAAALAQHVALVVPGRPVRDPQNDGFITRRSSDEPLIRNQHVVDPQAGFG
jgi:hypothetical protein